MKRSQFLHFNAYCMSDHEHKGIDLFHVIFAFTIHFSLR